MGNGALPHGPSYRAHPRLYHLRRPPMSAVRPLSRVIQTLSGYRRRAESDPPRDIGRLEIPQRSSLRAVRRCAIVSLQARQALAVKRRQFITLLCSAAAAWQLAARAQQGERVRRIGVLLGTTQSGPEPVPAFAQELRRLGWTEGRDVRIEYSAIAGVIERFRTYAAEYLHRKLPARNAGVRTYRRTQLRHGLSI